VAAGSKACVSAAARLLGLRVRILPGARMSVSCEYCQAEVSTTGRSLIQRSPIECACVSLSVIRRNNKFCNYNEQVVIGQDKEWKEGSKKERKIIFYKRSQCPQWPRGLRRVCVCGRSIVGIAGSNPAGGTDVCLL